MELTDYWRIIRRWKLLIVGGTVLALAIGLALHYENRFVRSTDYRATATVLIHYASPTYNPAVSLTDEAGALSSHAHDSAALGSSPRGSLPGVKGISAFVDPNAPEVHVVATATTRGVALTAANRVGAYLAHFEDSIVTKGAKGSKAGFARRVKYDKHQWLSHLRRYNVVAGPPPLVSRSALAKLSATVTYWQSQYSHDYGELQAFTTPGLGPTSLTTARTAHPLHSKPSSLTKTVLPAAVLGFLLTFLLAAFLEYRQSRSLTPQARLLGGGRPALPPRIPLLGHLQPSNLRLGQQAAQTLSQQPDARSKVVMALAESAREAADIVSRLVSGTNPTLLVTSPTTRDPKAETVVGLAGALAARGRRVVLVDADPVGGVTQFFGLEASLGLTDYLGYPGMSLTQLMYPCELSSAFSGGFAVLPFGVRRNDSADPTTNGSHNGNEAEAWRSGLAELAQAADTVLVNGSPALDSPDSLPFASALAGAVLVIRREQADRDLSMAYDVLRGQDVPVLGIVVNPGDRTLSRYTALGATVPPANPARLPETAMEYRETS